MIDNLFAISPIHEKVQIEGKKYVGVLVNNWVLKEFQRHNSEIADLKEDYYLRHPFFGT